MEVANLGRAQIRWSGRIGRKQQGQVLGWLAQEWEGQQNVCLKVKLSMERSDKTLGKVRRMAKIGELSDLGE